MPLAGGRPLNHADGEVAFGRSCAGALYLARPASQLRRRIDHMPMRPTGVSRLAAEHLPVPAAAAAHHSAEAPPVVASTASELRQHSTSLSRPRLRTTAGPPRRAWRPPVTGSTRWSDISARPSVGLFAAECVAHTQSRIAPLSAARIVNRKLN